MTSFQDCYIFDIDIGGIAPPNLWIRAGYIRIYHRALLDYYEKYVKPKDQAPSAVLSAHWTTECRSVLLLLASYPKSCIKAKSSNILCCYVVPGQNKTFHLVPYSELLPVCGGCLQTVL